MGKAFKVAIVGATGAVGEQMREVLAERQFPISELRLLASKKSEGTKLRFKGSELTVEETTPDSFKGIDIALFSAGGSVSQTFAPHAVNAGAVVIDNTSAFRMDPEIPLVVPEVNRHAIAGYKKRGIIANPNCSTIQMVVVLKPLHDEAVIKRVVVTTFQAVSGAGRSAMKELANQSIAIFNNKEYEIKKFPHRIAFNCLPHIGSFLDNLYTQEEMKMVQETQKIFEDNKIQVTATTVRVPVFSCHGEAINIEFEKPITHDRARELLCCTEAVEVLDDPSNNVYPMGTDVVGSDLTYVGRIREDHTVKYGINLWCVADNLRKGAATNAVQIAQVLADQYL